MEDADCEETIVIAESVRREGKLREDMKERNDSAHGAGKWLRTRSRAFWRVGKVYTVDGRSIVWVSRRKRGRRVWMMLRWQGLAVGVGVGTVGGRSEGG